MTKFLFKKISFVLLSMLFIVTAMSKEESFANQEISANREIGLTLDQYYSPQTGSSLAMSTIAIYDMKEDKILENVDSNFFTNSIRFVVSMLLNTTIMVTNHEVFGHGYRLRQAGIEPTYYISPFSGATHFSKYEYYNLASHNRIMIALGGMEASTVLGNNIRKKWLADERINSNYAMQYLFSQYDQTGYIKSSKTSEGNDVERYIKELNDTYGTGYITRSKLKHYAVLDYFDPFLYYSLYSAITNDKHLPCYMIPIGDYQYLPAARALLTPYGPEAQLLNFIKYDDVVTQINLSHGRNRVGKTHSVEVDIENLYIENKISFGLNMAIWKQPELLTNIPKAASLKVGGQLAVKAGYKIMDNIKLQGLVGYKAKGYKLGEALTRGAFVRAGIKVYF